MAPIRPAQEIVQQTAVKQEDAELGPFETMNEHVEQEDGGDLQRYDDQHDGEMRSPEERHREKHQAGRRWHECFGGDRGVPLQDAKREPERREQYDGCDIHIEPQIHESSERHQSLRRDDEL